MIIIPKHLDIGQYFWSEDAPGDVGIYRVRNLNGSRTHLYVDSKSSRGEATRVVRELNSGLETKSQED